MFEKSRCQHGNCKKPARSGGLCNSHYTAWLRAGKPENATGGYRSPGTLEKWPSDQDFVAYSGYPEDPYKAYLWHHPDGVWRSLPPAHWTHVYV